MAFRLIDFGIPGYDTNVNVLYKHTVETGESHICGDEEYMVAHIADTPVELVLRFSFEEDGQTPKEVIAHTFLDNPTRWQEGIKEEGEQAKITRGAVTLTAEIINPTALGTAYKPMLYPKKVGFGTNAFEAGCEKLMLEGVMVPKGDEVELLARVKHVQPIVLSTLWVFSVVELETAEGNSFVPVSRDVLEKMLDACNVGDLCYVCGPLSLEKTWA